MEIGNQIKQRRMALGLSQEELADRIYITRQTLSNWENGKPLPTSTAFCVSARYSMSAWMNL